VDIFLIAFQIENANEYNRGLNSLPVLLTNPSTYFEKPFKAADPAALFLFISIKLQFPFYLQDYLCVLCIEVSRQMFR
jgi:hypothetical protein